MIKWYCVDCRIHSKGFFHFSLCFTVCMNIKCLKWSTRGGIICLCLLMQGGRETKRSRRLLKIITEKKQRDTNKISISFDWFDIWEERCVPWTWHHNIHIRFSYKIFSNHCIIIIIKTLMVIMTLCPLCHLDASKYSIFHEDQVSGDPAYGHNNTTFRSLDPEYIDGHLFIYSLPLGCKGRR